MITLLIAIILLQIADLWTTWKVLNEGGNEKNPAMAFLMNWIGVLPALILTKALAITLCVLIYLVQPYVLIPLIIFYGVVVVRNFKQMK
jgi:hypothetical protein